LPASIAFSALANVMVLDMTERLRFVVTGIVTCASSWYRSQPSVQ
jgi:hypothetical protein